MKRLFIIAALLLGSRLCHAQVTIDEVFHLGETKDSILNKLAFSKNFRFGLSGTTTDKTSTYIAYMPKDFPDGALAYMFHADNICWSYSLDRPISQLTYAKSCFDNDNYINLGNNSWEDKSKTFKVQIPVEKITSNSFTIIYALAK